MNWFELSEDVVVFKLENTLALAKAIRHADLDDVVDVIISDEEVAVQYKSNGELSELIKEIDRLKIQKEQSSKSEIFELPVCYELGDDLEQVLEVTKLDKKTFIEGHSSIEYEATFGFIPGFVYLAGLPDYLHCPRKQTPRAKITAGSVGIGGGKTGIYSLESPGGWQIIGRTPLSFFDVNRVPPTPIAYGGTIKFKRISLDEFKNWDGGS